MQWHYVHDVCMHAMTLCTWRLHACNDIMYMTSACMQLHYVYDVCMHAMTLCTWRLHACNDIYTYKRVVCVCWFVGLLVCLLFIGHTTCVHFAALPPSGRESRSRRRGRPRALRGRKHAQREHGCACRTTSQRKKSLRWCLSKNN